ncbi:hypothetical protein DB347_25175 [Opitutaceae bacterium EW11]|nr:hypothetical protein DB347_25175 [Opitutaceae bacterium EW11]
MAPVDTSGLKLLISDKPDEERDALAAAFEACGGAVHRLGRFWDPPSFDPATVRVYGADSFCLVLQQKLGFSLCSPDDELLLRVPGALLKRRLTRQTLAQAQSGPLPMFIKPVVPKQFRGAVYSTADELAEECRGLAPDTAVIVSEIVTLTAEVRCFVLNNSVLDAAVYEGMADRAEAIGFATEVTQALALPRAVVLDIGNVPGKGWAVVEFNAAWGAGLNGCNAERVLPAVLAASAPQSS